MEQDLDIRLAPVGLEHAGRMLEWMLDPVIARNLGLRSEPTLARTVTWIEKSIADANARASAILLGGEHVGNVVLDEHDRYLGTARLSVYLGASRGRGIGRRAVALATHEGFEALDLQKVWLIVHAENEPAIRAYHAVGFVEEGRLREEFLLDGRRCDALRMGLLRRELRGH